MSNNSEEKDCCCNGNHSGEHKCGCHHGHEHGHNHEHGCGCHCEQEHNHTHSCRHDESGHENHHGDCSCGCHHHGGESRKTTVILLIISAILLACGYAITKFTSIPWWAELLIFLVPYFIAGADIIKESAENILHGEIFDENFLMTVATVAALVVGEYPEAVFVMIFFKIGELFEDIAVGKSRKNIEKLMDIRPDTARVLRNGIAHTVNPSEVAVGELIEVRAGEKIPIDGVIIKGNSSLNTVALTGESLPRDVEAGDEVKSGFVNIDGVIVIRTEKTFTQSTASKILETVRQSQSTKAPAERFITKFAKIYTPTVVICAVLLAVIPSIMTGYWKTWISRAMIFLVISCPCALVISVPLSFFGGIGGASQRGILLKGSTVIEELAKAKTVVFDKTGTLTKGCFTVSAIHTQNMTEAELLEYATLAECFSSHPISVSLKDAYGKEPDTSRVEQVREIPGHGITVKIDGRDVCVGNEKLMNAQHTAWRSCHLQGTVIHVTVDGKYAGHIVIADTPKEDSALAVHRLKELGIKKTVMLTGDRRAVADEVGESLGIDIIKSELLPEDKVTEVRELLKNTENRALIFVGDGINDAPVLAASDVGVAMGGIGSDAAIEAADAVIMDDKPSALATAIRISRKTKKIVTENIVFAIAVKVAVMALGAFGLAPIWLAVFADVGVMVIAVLNSLRTLRVKKL